MPCVVLSIMSRIASNTFWSPSDLMLWSSERNRKCSDMTPACGEIVAVFAEDTMAKSRSPALTSWRSCGSCPSCAPGYWSTSILPPLSCLSLARSEEHTSELQSHSDLVCRLLLEKKKK